MSMTLKTTKNLFFGLSVVFKITTRRSTIDVRKKSDLSRKNRTTGPPGHVRKISDQPQPGNTSNYVYTGTINSLCPMIRIWLFFFSHLVVTWLLKAWIRLKPRTGPAHLPITDAAKSQELTLWDSLYRIPSFFRATSANDAADRVPATASHTSTIFGSQWSADGAVLGGERCQECCQNTFETLGLRAPLPWRDACFSSGDIG